MKKILIIIATIIFGILIFFINKKYNNQIVDISDDSDDTELIEIDDIAIKFENINTNEIINYINTNIVETNSLEFITENNVTNNFETTEIISNINIFASITMTNLPVQTFYNYYAKPTKRYIDFEKIDTEINNTIKKYFSLFNNKLINIGIQSSLFESTTNHWQLINIAYNMDDYLATGFKNKKRSSIFYITSKYPTFGLYEDKTELFAKLDPAFTNLYINSIISFNNNWILGTQRNGIYIVNNDFSKVTKSTLDFTYFRLDENSFKILNNKLYCFGYFFDKNTDLTTYCILRSDDGINFESVFQTEKRILNIYAVKNTLVIFVNIENNNYLSTINNVIDTNCQLVLMQDDVIYPMYQTFDAPGTAFCYNDVDDMYVLFGNNNKVYVSNDLKNWNNFTINFYRPINAFSGLLFNNGVYILTTKYEIWYNKQHINKDSTCMYYSIDLINWYEMPSEFKLNNCGYINSYIFEDKFIFCIEEPYDKNNLVYSTIQTKFDRASLFNYLDKDTFNTKFNEHVNNEEIHFKPFEKLTYLYSTNSFDGKYESLRGKPKIYTQYEVNELLRKQKEELIKLIDFKIKEQNTQQTEKFSLH